MGDVNDFYIEDCMGNDADFAERQIYLDAEKMLRRNLKIFKSKVPPFVLELTFYDLWQWDIPGKIQAMMPDLKQAVFPSDTIAWNCVWLSKMTFPDYERCYCELIFFGKNNAEPDSPEFRKVMLELMHKHEEFTGYNIIGQPYEMPTSTWIKSLAQRSRYYTIQDSGEINPQK